MPPGWATGPGDTLAVLSVDEKLIALSRFEGGRLCFPQTVAVVGEPQAMELADLNQDGRLDLAYVAKGPDPADAFFLRSVLEIGQAGSEPGPSLKLTDVEERPQDLLACDIDHDGDTDLIVVRSYDPLLLVRQTTAGVFEQQAQDQTHSGLVSNLGSCGICLAPLGKDGRPALLVARGEFARSMYFDAGKGWQVIDQYQAGDGRRQIRVAAVVPGQAAGAPGIVAYDDASGIVFFMDPQADGTYRVSREIDVGTAKVRKILAGRFGAGDAQDLVLCAERELICLRPTAQWSASADRRVRAEHRRRAVRPTSRRAMSTATAPRTWSFASRAATTCRSCPSMRTPSWPTPASSRSSRSIRTTRIARRAAATTAASRAMCSSGTSPATAATTWCCWCTTGSLSIRRTEWIDD